MQFRLSHYATVYFFDENNDIIVRDAHSFVNTSFKFMRGYYPTRPVSRIVIVPKFYSGSMYYPTLYREPYQTFLTRHSALQDYPLEDYQHSANRMRFETNFNTSRFIVLNTPFDPGWRVTRILENGQKESTQVYSAQGGFIGFLSGEGKTQYEVRYWTPYLTEGILISLAGLAIFGGVIGATFLIQKRKKDFETDV